MSPTRKNPAEKVPLGETRTSDGFSTERKEPLVMLNRAEDARRMYNRKKKRSIENGGAMSTWNQRERAVKLII